MTDNEIIKALECCANNPNECVCYENKCPLFGQKCIDVLSKNALDLINRQKAEIEALIAGQETLQKYRDEEINRLEIELKAMRGAANSYKAEVERLQKENDVLIETYSKCQIAIIKGSIERIKQIVCDHCHPDFNKGGKPINVWDAVNGYKAIDNFFKEMAGASDG